ncbi:tail fiber domain-containing protein [Enterobacter hormaechei]|nr:tail fiber domain-containing protein [Enterobacter hormaechei]
MSNIFTGNKFKLFYNTDTGNRIPDNPTNVQVDELSAMPTLTIRSLVQTIETYDSDYVEKLLSEQDVSNIDIQVNYIATEASHKFLDAAAESQETFQLILQYVLEDNQLSYSTVNGSIAKTSLTGDKDSVVTKTYSFVPTQMIARMALAEVSTPVVVGMYGLGANGDSVPQYQPLTPDGNAFVKIPAAQAGNPASADMMGVGLVDGTTYSSLAMTKSGTLSLYAKNANTAWTRILTATQISAQYVPLTRTVNGKPLSSNIVLDKSDVGLGNVTNDAQLKIASNLSDVASVTEARTNLDVYSKATVDSKVATVQTSADSKLAKASNLSDLTNVATARTNLSVYSKAESDAGYMARAKNLSDVANVATSRTNLGLGTAAIRDVGTSGSTIPVLNGTNIWSGIQTFDAQIINFGQNATSSGVGIEIGSLKTAGTSYIDFHSSGTSSDYDARISVSGGSATTLGKMTITASSLATQSLELTNDLAIAHGGTGASTASSARANLQVFFASGTALSATDNLNDIKGEQQGIYRNQMSVYATPANNYPVQTAGSLVVIQTGANGASGCIQNYYEFVAGVMWTRAYNPGSGGEWSTWSRTIYTSDNPLVLYNSKVNNNMNLQSNGAVLIQSRSDGTGLGTVYNTVFNTNGTISGPQGTVQQVASDIRLKSDVVPAKEGALERINAIGCVEFTWDWEGRRDRGFIAQQIAGIDDLYTFTPDVEGAYLNYSMTALMSDTFGAIQDLTAIKDSQASKIESLENTIESQQTQIDELKELVQQLIAANSTPSNEDK